MSKKCKLCGKTFNNDNYKIFGKGCFKNICELLNVKIPENMKEEDKENYLCKIIAKRLNKRGLTIKQKRYLTELFLITIYIDKIDYVNLNKLKSTVQRKIKNINFISGVLFSNKDLSMALYAMYRLYNSTETFKKNIAEIEEMYKNDNISEDIKNDKKAINYFKYIYDVTKIVDPKFYALNYYRQYVFWKTVISGGLLFKYDLATKLLQHSLSETGEDSKIYNVTDQKIIEEIKQDSDLISKINEIIQEHNEEEYFRTDYNGEKESIAFEHNTDLKYALHNVEVIVEGNKNENNKWDLNIEIQDRFDFTDFVFPDEYDKKYKEIEKDKNRTIKEKAISSAKNGIGYTLNNMALASVQYGVLKEFDVKIQFTIANYSKEGE